MKKNVIQEKSLDFAVRVINLYKFMKQEKQEFVLSKQLLRSGTSIGANISEALFGQSKADFIHKLAIAQKECNETLYWLELLRRTDFLNQTQFESINIDAVELMKILTSILKKMKSN